MDMPARSDAARVLKQLKNILGYRIFLFSHRPWPDFGEIPEDKESNLKCLWTGRNLKSITHVWLQQRDSHAEPFHCLARPASTGFCGG